MKSNICHTPLPTLCTHVHTLTCTQTQIFWKKRKSRAQTSSLNLSARTTVFTQTTHPWYNTFAGFIFTRRVNFVRQRCIMTHYTTLSFELVDDHIMCCYLSHYVINKQIYAVIVKSDQTWALSRLCRICQFGQAIVFHSMFNKCKMRLLVC